MKEQITDETNLSTPELMPEKSPGSREPGGLTLTGTWMIAISLVLLAVYLGWRVQTTQAASDSLNQVVPTQTSTPIQGSSSVNNELPVFYAGISAPGISRRTTMHTNIPTRPRTKTIEYTVDTGDSVFGIAQSFNLEPETILWANYDQLNDSPDMLNPGMKLNVPPVNGVYYQWQEGDLLEAVAAKFEANIQDILNWEGNDFDLTNPQVAAEQWLMIPEGHREFRQWLVPTIARSNSGV